MRLWARKLKDIVKKVLDNPTSIRSPIPGVYPTVAKKQLPKLPIPSLSNTLRNYLDYARVITTDAEFLETKKIVERFQTGQGPEIQQALEAHAEKSENWHNDFWLNDMYLNIRLALPINSNPAYIFPRQEFNEVEDLIRFAALVLCGAYVFKENVDSRKLEIDRATGKQGGQPMCMNQYYRMFTSFRMPGTPRDILEMKTTETLRPGSEHVIVMCKDQPYVVKTMINGARVPMVDMMAQLRAILNMARRFDGFDIPVGCITAADRDKAALAYLELMKNPENVKNIDEIKGSSFLLCIDEALGIANPTQEEQLHHILSGSGSSHSSTNRWFDKTNQFIITTDGICGVNFEHSVAEGIVLVNMVETTLKYIEENKYKKIFGDIKLIEEPKRLNWTISPTLYELIDECRTDFDKAIEDTRLKVFHFEDYGKEFAKSKKCSPDAFLQLVLQLTYYRLHGHLASTYESASTRRYRHGRVDNIRAAHTEALAWVRIVEDAAADPSTKLIAFRKAMEKQTKVMLENVTGHGIDNHLVALRELAVEKTSSVPELFEDPPFTKIFQYPLSTSQGPEYRHSMPLKLDPKYLVSTFSVPTVYPGTYICYGAVVPHGYACCYNLKSNSVIFAISDYRSCSKTDANRFAEVLDQTLKDVRQFLETHA